MKRNLRNILDNLAPVLKEAYYSDNTLNSIEDAARLGQVNADVNQLNIIEEEVMNVLLGRSSLNNFKETLKSRLNTHETNLTIINKVIQDKIFETLKNDLDQLQINKPKLTFQNIPQKETITSKTILEIPKLESNPKKTETIKGPAQKQNPFEITKTRVSTKKQATEENVSEQIIPEYSFPEPSEVKIKKPLSKIEELKKVITPSISSEQQEKIRKNLLAAMQKKETQPKILEQMKKVLLKPLKPKEKEEEVPEKKKAEELTSSKILSGKGKKFKDEETFVKTKEEKPYILDVKLKEENQKEKETPTSQEPIPYRKYQKKNPFGEA